VRTACLPRPTHSEASDISRRVADGEPAELDCGRLGGWIRLGGGETAKASMAIELATYYQKSIDRAQKRYLAADQGAALRAAVGPAGDAGERGAEDGQRDGIGPTTAVCEVYPAIGLFAIWHQVSAVRAVWRRAGGPLLRLDCGRIEQGVAARKLLPPGRACPTRSEFKEMDPCRPN
jgi:hypothetical protein